MSDRHANINEDVLTAWILDDPSKHFPGVEEDVGFQEVVEAAIASDL